MIIGSGVIATALRDRTGVVQYAAGVSNSQCQDADEFKRDRDRLQSHLEDAGRFVYFSTCSNADNAYVAHKRQCEDMVRNRGGYLIVRLPIVAGKTTNPHTLLNFLNSRISRSELFDLVPEARRNVIDVIDMGIIVNWLIKSDAINETINVAAPMDYSMRDIVSSFEQLLGKRAVVREHPGGHEAPIDVSRIEDAPVCWDGDYLDGILWNRYG